MSAAQIAVNSRALMTAADKLTRAGYDGDAYRFVEDLALNLLADGYRPVEPPPPRRGPGASATHRAQVLAETRTVIEAARRARTTTTDTTPPKEHTP